jgi:hypothetical protein
VLSISDCIAWGGRITDGWKGFGRKWLCLINILFWNFPGHEKSNKKFIIASILAAIQSGKLSGAVRRVTTSVSEDPC